jgi:hypothetical protein
LFDGALPDSKHDERLSRTDQNNKRVGHLRRKHSTTACPTPTYLGSSAYAFLAPSLREALKASSFASRTNIVPGEADDFCAVHARDTARSIIFSSDSDLLLYDYPPETLIAFVHEAEPAAGLMAYSPHQIRDALKVKSLVALACAIQQKSSDKLKALVCDAQCINMNSALYLDFSRRYTVAVVAPTYPARDGNLQDLDVRVSEFAHQALGDSPRPVVYLPLLVEDPNQASAWTIGQDIRTLTYALLALPDSTVQEYRRKAHRISSHDISLSLTTDIATLLEQTESQVSALLKWAALKAINSTLLWSLFAVSLVLAELNTAPSPQLVARVLNADFDNTWTFVQLSARIQSALYSLRILKQIVSVRLALDQHKSSNIDDVLTRLNTGLSSLPSIPELFIIPGQVPRVLADHESMKELVAEIYTAAGVLVTDPYLSKQKKKKTQGKRKKSRTKQKESFDARGSNAFALLDE